MEIRSQAHLNSRGEEIKMKKNNRERSRERRGRGRRRDRGRRRKEKEAREGRTEGRQATTWEVTKPMSKHRGPRLWKRGRKMEDSGEDGRGAWGWWRQTGHRTTLKAAASSRGIYGGEVEKTKGNKGKIRR